MSGESVNKPSTPAETLRRNANTILERWADLATGEIGIAVHQGKLALYNGLPGLLDRIASALENNKPLGVTVASKEHGEQRAKLGEYSLKQVICEYELLRRTVFEVLRSGGPLSDVEEEIILKMMSDCVTEAAVEFARVQEAVREQYIAILSHDLRNPLTAAKAAAEMVLRSPNNLEAVQRLGVRLVESLSRIDRMIQDLLHTHQIRAGRPLRLKIERCNMAKIASEVFEELKMVHGDRFILNCSEDVIGFWSAEGLRRSIENLANNAVKYGSMQCPITISVLQVKDIVQISVHNEGSPIIEQEQASLFKAYKRLSDAQKSGKRGWGLGLVLVKGMAEAHGGNITVHSSAKKGTTFTISLPKDARPYQRGLNHEAA